MGTTMDLPILDPEVLDALAEGAGRETALRIRDIFLADLDRLSRALQGQPPLPELHSVIHQIAGAAGSFGAVRLATTARRLDDHCARRAAAPPPSDLAMLSLLLSQTRSAAAGALA